MPVTYSTEKGAVRFSPLDARALKPKVSPIREKPVFMLRRSEIVADPLEKLPTAASGKGRRPLSKNP